MVTEKHQVRLAVTGTCSQGGLRSLFELLRSRYDQCVRFLPVFNLLPLLCFLGCVPVSAQTILPLWPNGVPGEKNVAASEVERDLTGPADGLVAGRRVERLSFVSVPTLTVYRPDQPQENGAAVVVFPGGAYQILAWDLEGTEVCSWLNSLGMTCAILKYRVPNAGPFPLHTQDLADAQQSVRLMRAHAAEWRLDPKRIGVLGFSAGGHLAAALSSHAGDRVAYGPDSPGPNSLGPEAPKPSSLSSDPIEKLSAAPSFALLIYPAYLVQEKNLHVLRPELQPNATTPPTFLVQAEDDPIHAENALGYYGALMTAKVPAEMHLYTAGGHGYGLRPTALAVTHWPDLAAQWFRTIGVLPPH